MVFAVIYLDDKELFEAESKKQAINMWSEKHIYPVSYFKMFGLTVECVRNLTL